MKLNTLLAHIIECGFHGDQLQKDVTEAGLRPQGRAAWQKPFNMDVHTIALSTGATPEAAPEISMALPQVY